MSKRKRRDRGQFRWDRCLLILLMLAGIGLSGRVWLAENPQHNPWAPLDLRHPPGWATTSKLMALRQDLPVCRAVLERSEVAFTGLDPQGSGTCARPDRTVLASPMLSPARPVTTCPVAAGLHLWIERSVQPAAKRLLGSQVVRVEHYGTYSCRRIYGGDAGRWSQHATGNAIDIAGFVLADGTRITVLRDWSGDDAQSAFLHSIRSDACAIFGTVLSPDYNAAHRDHFHLDQEARGLSGLCR